MPDEKIRTVYIGLIRQPRRFVLHRKNADGRDTYEVIKSRTFREFTRALLTTLNGTQTDFMVRLAKLDDDQWMKSKHKTRRYIAERQEHVYINSEHLTDKNTEQLLGYWVATNVGRKETSALASLACQAAGVPRESVYGLQL